MTHECCSACGFDSGLYDENDTISSQLIIPAVLGHAIERLPEAVLARRPDAQTWSIAEYVDHVREVAFGNRFAIEVALDTPGTNLGSAPQTGPRDERAIDVERSLRGVHREFEAIRNLLGSISDTDWDRSVIVDDASLTVGWFARHVLHDGLHHLADIGRIRKFFGHGAPTASGLLVQVNVSDGGVPKRPIDEAHIGPSGVAGDVQQDRRHHGRPAQAICLWSQDVIDAHAREGHPIAAGSAGENLTITGIDWSTLRPGSLLRVGAITLLVTAYAIPCAKNAQWFTDGDFSRMLHERNPGQSRLYAIPLGHGPVTVGANVTVEPLATASLVGIADRA